MELVITGSNNKVSVSDAVFGRDFSEDLVHQVVVAYRNAGRAGTKPRRLALKWLGTPRRRRSRRAAARVMAA